MCQVTTVEFKNLTTQYVALPEDRTHCVLSGEKFWFFGKTFFEQPTHNSGHFICHGGNAHVTFFDATTSSWDSSRPTLLNRVASDENMNEVIFMFQTRIFLLLHTAFGALSNASLHEFDESRRQWTTQWNVKIDLPEDSAVSEDPNAHLLTLVEGADPDGVYFIDAHANVYRLVVPWSQDGVAELKLAGKFETKRGSSTLDIRPVMAALVSDKGTGAWYIVALGGVHGCGFLYHYDLLLRLNLTSGESNVIKVESNNPGQAWSALKLVGAFPMPDAITIFGGMKRVKMTSSAFDGAIWTLTGTTSTAPSWELCSVTLPSVDDATSLQLALRPEVRELFVFSKSDGVSKIRFS